MDILYVVGKGLSECDNQELRYSLRSIEKYGKNVGRVFVVGYCPEWLSDEVVKVPYEQPHNYLESPDPQVRIGCKQSNIIAPVLYAVDNTDIQDEFLVSMDDHFYIREVDFDNYPYYARDSKNGPILPKVGKTEYRKCLAKTRALLEKNNLSVYWLTLHRNMHCSRPLLNECRQFIQDGVENKLQIEYLAYLLNYLNTKYNIEITTVGDVKVKNGFEWYKINPESTEVFSTMDYTSNSRLAAMIKNLYKDKSKYEK